MNNPTTGRLIPLKQCIYEYIDQSLQDRGKYRRLYPIGVRGMIELGVDVFMSPKEAKLNIESNKTVKFPDDCLSILSVGLLNQRGEFTPLKNQPDISTVKSSSYFRVENNKDNSVGSLGFLYSDFFLNYDFTFPDNLYGLSGGSQYIGEYKIDYNKDAILFSDDFKSNYIIIKYMAIPCDEDFLIPFQAREAMLAWLAWKDIQNVPLSSKVSAFDKRDRRHEYYVQKKNAKLRITPLNLSDAGDVEREGIRLVPKA